MEQQDASEPGENVKPDDVDDVLEAPVVRRSSRHPTAVAVVQASAVAASVTVASVTVKPAVAATDVSVPLFASDKTQPLARIGTKVVSQDGKQDVRNGSTTQRGVNATLRMALTARSCDIVANAVEVRVPPGFVERKAEGGYFRRLDSRNKNKSSSLQSSKVPWEEVEPHIFPDKKIKVAAYINDVPGMYSCEEICDGFERYGYISISATAQIGEEPTVAEQSVIHSLNVNIESVASELTTKDPELAVKLKIINASEETDFLLQYTKFDHGRRAKFHNFSRMDPVAQYHNSMLDIVKCCGILDPGVEMINSRGNWGMDVLAKLPGTGDQEDHTDNSVDPSLPLFKSYADTLNCKEKYRIYNTRRDGAVNSFTNSSNTIGDCLVRPGGKPIPLPVLTTTFVAGYLPHHGTGNYSRSTIFKHFGYGDSPDFNRAGAVQQFKVFHYAHANVVIRWSKEPYHEVYHKELRSYQCVMCGRKDYFLDPYCACCMLHHFDLLLCCEGSNTSFNLGLMYVGGDGFECDEIVVGVDAEIMTSNEYHIRFKDSFRAYGLVGVIELPPNSSESEQLYVIYMVRHTFLAALETSMDPDLYNVELTDYFDDGCKPVLRATKHIVGGIHTKLVLRAQKPLCDGLMMDPITSAFTAAHAIMDVYQTECEEQGEEEEQGEGEEEEQGEGEGEGEREDQGDITEDETEDEWKLLEDNANACGPECSCTVSHTPSMKRTFLVLCPPCRFRDYKKHKINFVHEK